MKHVSLTSLKHSLALVLYTGFLVSAYAETKEIDTVVVSATRSAIPLGSAPSNIAVLQQAQILRTQAEHIQQNLSQVPGVSLQRGDGQESLPGIRSAVLTGAGACGNVLIMEEGIPVRGPAFCNVNELFDTHYEQASQIEVTRGPGTSFYGANSLTGSVNILLPNQGDDYVSLELGEHAYKRAKGAYSYTNDVVQGRLYATITDTDSFRDDSGYAQQKISWRHAQDIADWSINAGFTLARLDQQTAGFITGLDSYQDLNLVRQNLDPEAFRKTESFRAWSRFRKKTATGYQWQVTPYLRSTDMDFRLHFLPGDPLEQNQQFGFGWQSSLSRQVNNSVSWSVGLDADFSDGELKQTQAKPTQGSAFLRATIPTGTHYDYKVNARQVGIFSQLNWQINDTLRLISGLRAERLEYEYDNLSLDGRTRDDGMECGFGGCRYSRPADRTDSFSNLSPKLELQVQISDQSTLYASAASSFRAPQATELYRLQRQQQVTELDSVEAENIELGYRYRNDDTQFAASVYRLNQKNVIIRDSDFFNVDGNQTHSQGLEVSLRHAISPQLSTNLAITLAKHEYASDQLSGDTNINGKQIDTAPRRLLNASLVWQVNPHLSSQLELQHSGAYFLEPENLRQYPGHEVWHLRVNYQLSPKVSLMTRVLNVADTRYAERADFTSFTDERYFPGQPRSVYFGVRYRPHATR